MTSTEDAQLQRENMMVLDVVQALVGEITPNFIAVNLRFESERCIVVFWLRERNEEIDQDIDDIIGDVEAYMGEEGFPVMSEVNIGVPPPARGATQSERMVFRIKGNG
jgi:hypothetical protein